MSTITNTLVNDAKCGCQFQGEMTGQPAEADDGRWSPMFFMKVTRKFCSAPHFDPNFLMLVLPKESAAQVQHLLGAYSQNDWAMEIGELELGNFTWVHRIKA